MCNAGKMQLASTYMLGCLDALGLIYLQHSVNLHKVAFNVSAILPHAHQQLCHHPYHRVNGNLASRLLHRRFPLIRFGTEYTGKIIRLASPNKSVLYSKFSVFFALLHPQPPHSFSAPTLYFLFLMASL